MKGGVCLLVSLDVLLTVCLPFTNLGDPLTVEEKDEVNSSALHWYVSPAHRELCLPCT